jgi:hypothetical protein
MRVISVIENEEVIRKILKHLGLGRGRPGRHPKPTPHRKMSI